MPRKLKPELATLIRSRIPLSDVELVVTPPSELFQMAYAALEGIREDGKNAGKEVEMIQYSVGLSPGDAWCMAAAQCAIRFVELTLGITSPVASGGHCLTVARQSPPNVIMNSPMQGDLIIYQHGDTDNGHVEGIMEIYSDKFAFTMGANTSSGPGINRDGDGVFFRMRSLKFPEGNMKIYCFIRPFPIPYL